MIPVAQLAQLAGNVVAQVALDKFHRRMQGGFDNTEITVSCGWSGNDIILKIKNIRGQVSGQTIATPPKKKIILPPGAQV